MPLSHGQDQFQSLLMGHARDHAEQRRIGIDLQAKFLLQILLATLLAGRRAAAELALQVLGNQALGLPVVGVDAVENAGELMPTLRQQALHAHAEWRRLDFLGVGGRYRGDVIGVEQAGFEERQIAVVLDTFNAEAGCRVRFRRASMSGAKIPW